MKITIRFGDNPGHGFPGGLCDHLRTYQRGLLGQQAAHVGVAQSMVQGSAGGAWHCCFRQFG